MVTELDRIGFYTLSDERARTASETSPMMRGEIILTSACNFRCPYCRPQRDDCRGTMPASVALETIHHWSSEGLRNVRFSGGEPTLHPSLPMLIEECRFRGVARIAVSTNGSAKPDLYADLLALGVNDFSISLDACCASRASEMSGGLPVFDAVAGNIAWLAERCYVTVGVVVTDANLADLPGIIAFADSLGVADIRVISEAKAGPEIAPPTVPSAILTRHPILAYRMANLTTGRSVRGLSEHDCRRCHLAIDDALVAGRWHFPCTIYFRERGEPIGKVGPSMRSDRAAWVERHDSHADPICHRNCLDVCVDYNNRAAALRDTAGD